MRYVFEKIWLPARSEGQREGRGLQDPAALRVLEVGRAMTRDSDSELFKTFFYL